MPEAIYISNIAATPITATAADQTVITGNIKANMYNYARIFARVEISVTATAVTTNNTLKIKVGSSTVATFNFRVDAPTGVGTRVQTVNLEYIGDLSLGGAVTVTAAGAGTDAQTTFTGKALYVTSIQ